MHKLRSVSVGLAAFALVAAASAQFDGPAPLAWRSVQPTSVSPGGSPVVNGDDIYQAMGGRIYCLDRTTGNKKWQFPQVEQIPGVFRNSPVLVNGTLVAAGDNKIVYAVDAATGQSKWNANLPTGSLGMPVVSGNMVVLALSDNSLYALNVTDGSAAWTNPYKVYDGISGTIGAFGNDVLVFTNRQELVGINATTQKMDWHRPFTQLPPNPSVTISGDTVYTNSGPYLIALNASNGNPRWQTVAPFQLAMSPVVSQTSILLLSDDGKAVVVDPGTHKVTTPKPLDLGSLPITKPTVVGNGEFIIPTSNGALNLIDVNTPAAGTTPPTPSSSTGASQPFSNGVPAHSLWAYIIRPLPDSATASPANNQAPGRGGFGGFGGGQSNTNKEEKITSIQAAAPAVLAGQTLIVAARDGSVLAFDRSLGVDLTAPKVDMLFPNAGDQISGQPPLLLYFRLEDEASGLRRDSVKVEINGQPYDFTLGKDDTVVVRFSLTGKNRPLPDGRKEIVVTASDWMGNQVKKSFALSIDNALPPIKLPGQDTNTNGPGGGPGKGGGGGSSGIGG